MFVRGRVGGVAGLGADHRQPDISKHKRGELLHGVVVPAGTLVNQGIQARTLAYFGKMRTTEPIELSNQFRHARTL